MKKIKVVGHKAPDTDAVCSAISYAWYLDKERKVDAEAFVLGSLNKETEFVLKKFGIETPKLIEKFTSDDLVVIVDTNNLDELAEGIEKANLVEIIDHHKLAGGLGTDHAIPITIRPVACTATLIWEKFKQEKITKIPSEIAGIMLSAILSDSLNFTSPTTAKMDEKAAEELTAICGEDVDELCDGMFEAKSDLSGMDAKDILLVDSKVYKTNGKKVRYSVLETTDPDNALSMKGDLLKGMGRLKRDEGLDYLFFMLVDILKSEARLLAVDEKEKEIAEKAFSKKFEGDILVLPGVVSRKKQLIPAVEKFL